MACEYRVAYDETAGSYKHGPSNAPLQSNLQPLFTPRRYSASMRIV
jgi:hypothetical protein